MLQNIRDKTQGWFTSVVIGVICVTFVFWGIHSFSGGGNTPNRVAKVDGVAISQAQLNATYNRLREQQQMQLGAGFVLTDAVQQKLRQSALQQLISSQALAAAATQEGLRFNPDQVGQVIGGISAFQDNGHFSPTRFVQAIASLGFTEQGFYDDVRNAMLINQMRVGLVGSNFSLPDEIAQALLLINQKRTIQFVTFLPKTYLSQAVVSPADIQAYYQQHQDHYKTAPAVTLQYLQLNLQDLVAQQHIDPSDAKRFYEANVSNYTIPAKWQLQTVFLAANSSQDGQASLKVMQQVVADLKQGKALDQLKATNANLQIQDSYWLNDKDLDPAIQSVVNHLSKGQVSAPIETAQGLVVVKLVAKQKAAVSSFEQVKAQVTQSLAQQKATQAFADASDELSQLTYTHPESLTAAATKLSLPLKTTVLLTEASPHVDLWANVDVRKAAFSSDVLAGNNSALINLNDSQVAVVRVLKSQPASVLPLTQVSAAIKTLLLQQKANLLAKADSEQLLRAIRTGQDPKALMQRHHWQWTQVKEAGRYSSSVNGAILNAAFQLAPPNKSPSIDVFRLAPDGFAVVQLLSITAAKSAELSAIQQRVMAQQIASGYAQLDYQLYVNGVMKKASIEVNQSPATLTPDE